MFKKKLEKIGLFHNYKFKSMFFKYFFVFIILIVLPATLLGTVAYKGFYDNLNKEIGKANANTLNKALQSIDTVLSNIEKLTGLYASNPNLVDYLVNPNATTLQDFGVIINHLSNISSSNFVLSAYIFNGYNNTILSSTDGLQPFNTFYDRAWKEAYDNSDSSIVWMNTRIIKGSINNEYNCITLIRRLPYNTEDPLGAIVINIDEDKLSSMMKEQNQDGALMYIVNQEGKIISHPDKKLLYQNVRLSLVIQKIFSSDAGYFMNKGSRGNTLYAFSTSMLMGWKYICELSASNPLEQAENTKRLTLFVIIIYISFGLVFAFFMANKFYSPIQHLMASVRKGPADFSSSILSKAKERFNEYVFIENAYSSLIGLNSYLENSLKKTIPVLADKFFKDILLGKKVVELAELKDLFDKYNMDIELNNFFIMAIKIDHSFMLNRLKSKEEFELYKQLLIQSGKEIVGGSYKGYVSEIDTNLIAMMVNVDSNSEVDTAVETIEANLKQAISGYKNVTITIGVGNFYTNMNDTSFSYCEAIEALNNKFYYGKDIIIRYTEIESVNRNNKYDDLVNEQKFINFVKTKDIKSITSLINEIAAEIYAKRIDEHFAKQIFSKLIVTIVNSFAEEYVSIRNIVADTNSVFDAIHKADTLDDLKDIVISTFDKIIISIGDKNTNRHIDEIMNYIHKNYHKEISLISVAEKVSLSPSYISKVFREWTGKNFAEYLAMYRVNVAKEIIHNESIPINEVIKRVGFNNIQTFMRTFKKYEGITPGQFKQNM